MGTLINNMKIIHTSTFTIIHTNFNHYLETNTKKTKRNNNMEERVSQPQRGYYL